VSLDQRIKPLRIPSLPGISILAAVLCLTACQEKLPAYVEPDTPLEASIIIDEVLWESDITRISPDFTLIIKNTSDSLNSYVVEVPYEVHVDITVLLVRDPLRKAQLEEVVRYTDLRDNLRWSYFLLIGFELPLEDDEGRVWDWPYTSDIEYVDLDIQGKVRIPKMDLEVNTPRTRTRLMFGSP
jgi:hypothetical protein